SSKSGGGGVSGVARIGGVCADQRDGVVADSVYFTQSSSYAGQMAAAGGAPAKQPQLRPGQSSDSGSVSYRVHLRRSAGDGDGQADDESRQQLLDARCSLVSMRVI
uniref:Ysc84 domain-containing protein n=1 Tax=Macrostomum lignano TaxID=282301 RepID=A0A1I8J246_9PLAT